MSSQTNLITTALEYLDINTEKYESIVKETKYIKLIKTDIQTEYVRIELYDKNKVLLYKSRVENIGIYNSDTKTWAWGWAIPSFNKNLTATIRKILNYGVELDTEFKFLKTELITSRFKITDPIQLDIHIAIASYLAKKPFIFCYKRFINYIMDDNKLIDINKSKTMSEDEEHYSLYYLFMLDSDLLENKNF